MKRLDIQGLRMVAVLLVVADHLFGWPHGGFIGVDVFFVISGFLITGSLLHTIEKTGRISFSNFYRRRIRRIVPAATLVLVVTVGVAYFVFNGSRFNSTWLDAVAGFLFVSNWRFAIEGTDYFNASGPVSPLQHYWSLSVEEQFYFVWPAVIFVVSMVAIRLAWTGRARVALLAGVMGTVIAVSFAYAVLDTSTDPSWAYFSTLTRVWELGIGAIVMILISQFQRIPEVARPIIAWSGLILILVGAFTITETGGGFPAPWAAVPVLGAALVIIAGIGGEQRYLQILTNKASIYIGDISYSLYLWHWPIIVLLGSVIAAEGWHYYLGALFMMFGVSAAAYHFFEDRVRRSSWLETASEVKEGQLLSKSRWRLPRLRLNETDQKIGTISLAILVAGLSMITIAVTTPTPQPSFASSAVTAGGLSSAELTGRDRDIADALSANEWPAGLTPSLDSISKALPLEDSAGCGNVSHTDPATCTFGSGDRTAVVVGDSIALTWIATVRAILEPQGWQVRGLTKAGCPYVETDIDGKQREECADHREWVTQRINELRPDLVIVSGTEDKIAHLASGASGDTAAQEWQAGSATAYRNYAAAGAKVVVVSPPPSGKDPQECVTRTSTPADCVSKVGKEWYLVSRAESAAAAEAGATYVDTRRWFCTESDYCPMFVGNITVKRDSVHMTPEYSVSIAPELSPILTGA